MISGRRRWAQQARRAVVMAALVVAGPTTVDAAAGRVTAPGDRPRPGQVEGGPTAGAALDLEGANALLDERERALATGDREAWMRTIDPEAPDGFREAQGRQFDGLRSLPLQRFALTARLIDSGDLNPDPARFVPETRMSYRLGTYDDRDAVDHLWLTFVVRDGALRIASDTDVEDVGLDTARGLWDTGAVEQVTTEHFLVLHHPPQGARAREIAAIAEEALAVLRSRYDRPWSERLPIILPADTDELEVLLQSTIDLDKFVAFVSYGALRDGGYFTTAPRMYIQDDNLAGYQRPFQLETLVHELVHAATAPLTGPAIPAWVQEGVADWIATGRSTTERKPPAGDGSLPRDHEFSTGSQSAIVRAYRESRSATATLADRRELGAPTAFFAELGADVASAGSVDRRVDLALRRSSGLGLDELEEAWAGR